MKTISKNQAWRKNMINRLLTWSLLLVAVFSLCVLTGCRMFTVD
ncbi:MAG: hypothetical protein WAX69_12740 [Victivallales bacterium]